MEKLQKDVAIIGAGSAGIRAYLSALRWTKNVVLIEGGPFGTTCARLGCMPTLLLIAAADATHAVREAPKLGINIEGKIRVDGAKVMMRIRSERDRFVDALLKTINEIEPSRLLRGYARFLDDHTLQVDAHTLVQARSIVIATGSTHSIPSVLQGLGDRLLISDDVFQWRDLPSSISIFGAGFIGLEFGQAFHRLGIKTVIFGKGGFVGPLSDPAIREYAVNIFRRELELHPDAEVLGVKRDGNQVIIHFRDLKGKERLDGFDYALAATGRISNIKGLGLENTSLKLNEKGVPLFDQYTLQCENSHIFIAGDANHDRPFMHEAADEGIIAGENAARLPDIRAGHRRAPLNILFSDPQIGMAGYCYKDLEGRSFIVGEASFEDQGRSRIMLMNKGLIHVYAEPGTGLLLGAEMVGPCAEHISHLLAWAFQQKMTVPKILEMPFYHPVVEGGLRNALEDARTKIF